jgi:hypothetical protein
VNQYSGCIALLFIRFQNVTFPKILRHAAMSWFIAPFLKIYGDGPTLSTCACSLGNENKLNKNSTLCL